MKLTKFRKVMALPIDHTSTAKTSSPAFVVVAAAPGATAAQPQPRSAAAPRRLGATRVLALALTGLLVAVGLGVGLPASAQADPILTWTAGGTIPIQPDECNSDSPGFRALGYGDGTFVAIHSSGQTFRSLDDGVTWQAAGILPNAGYIPDMPGSLPYKCILRKAGIAFGVVNGTPTWVVAPKEQGVIFTSTNGGENWISQPFTNGQPTRVAFGDGHFLIGSNGTNETMTSTNGITWVTGGTVADPPSDLQISSPAHDGIPAVLGWQYRENSGDFAFGNHRFLFLRAFNLNVCTRNTNPWINAADADATNVYQCLENVLIDNQLANQSGWFWKDLVFDSGTFLGAMDATDLPQGNPSLQYTTDNGATWHASNLAAQASGLVAGDGYFIADTFTNNSGSQAETATTFVSNDGLHWSAAGERPGGREFHRYYGSFMAFGNHHFVGVGNDGSSSVGVVTEGSATPSSPSQPNPQESETPVTPPTPTPSASASVTASPTASPSETATSTPVANTFSAVPQTVSGVVTSGVATVSTLPTSGVQRVTSPVADTPAAAPVIAAPVGSVVVTTLSGVQANTDFAVTMSAVTQTRARSLAKASGALGHVRSTSKGTVRLPAIKVSRSGTYLIQLQSASGKASYVKLAVRVPKKKATTHATSGKAGSALGRAVKR